MAVTERLLKVEAQWLEDVEGRMYILFEYGAILGLIAVAAGLLFVLSAALVGLAEWFLRTSHPNASIQDAGSRPQSV